MQIPCFEITVGFLFVIGAAVASIEIKSRRAANEVGIYYSLDEILYELEKFKTAGYTDVQEYLEYFYSYYGQMIGAKNPTMRKHPFILLLEPHVYSRTKLAIRYFAENIGGTSTTTFSRNLERFRIPLVDRGDRLKWLFHSLAMYVNSFDISLMLEDGPVVSNGYWMRHAGYNMAKMYVPETGSTLYKFPTDLVAPDIVFYFSYSSQTKEYSIKKVPPDVERVMAIEHKVFHRFMNPSVIELNASFIRAPVMKKMREIIKEKLSLKFNHLSYLKNIKASYRYPLDN